MYLKQIINTSAFVIFRHRGEEGSLLQKQSAERQNFQSAFFFPYVNERTKDLLRRRGINEFMSFLPVLEHRNLSIVAGAGRIFRSRGGLCRSTAETIDRKLEEIFPSALFTSHSFFFLHIIF